MLHKRIVSNILLFILAILLFACLEPPSEPLEKLIIGAVSYERGNDFVNKYYGFQNYLVTETKTIIELEPTFNERQAIERIERRIWSVIFAPPGLAAIAIDREGYIPIFPLAGQNLHRSVIVVKADSNLQQLRDLSNKIIALGQRGSATGYYLPLYDLYGITVNRVRFAPTPKTILQWLEDDVIDAGALSKEEFDLYRTDFRNQFRILHQTRLIPSGSVLLNPDLDLKLQEKIKTVMKQVPTLLSTEVGYLPNSPAPDYKQFIILVNKVRPLERKLNKEPVVLTKD